MWLNEGKSEKFILSWFMCSCLCVFCFMCYVFSVYSLCEPNTQSKTTPCLHGVNVNGAFRRVSFVREPETFTMFGLRDTARVTQEVFLRESD